MPAWIHDRAEHLLAKNPSMSKSTAFAIATQQSHAKGKTPKSYGTKAGRQEAKTKFDKPKKEYEGTANPGKLESPKMASSGSLLNQWLDSTSTPETEELDNRIGSLVQKMNQIPLPEGSILPWRNKNRVAAGKDLAAVRNQLTPLLRQRAAVSGWKPSLEEEQLDRDLGFFDKTSKTAAKMAAAVDEFDALPLVYGTPERVAEIKQQIAPLEKQLAGPRSWFQSKDARKAVHQKLEPLEEELRYMRGLGGLWTPPEYRGVEKKAAFDELRKIAFADELQKIAKIALDPSMATNVVNMAGRVVRPVVEEVRSLAKDVPTRLSKWGPVRTPPRPAPGAQAAVPFRRALMARGVRFPSASPSQALNYMVPQGKLTEEALQGMWHGLPEQVQNMIKSQPGVAEGMIQPHQALAWMHAGRNKKSGESLIQTIMRQTGNTLSTVGDFGKTLGEEAGTVAHSPIAKAAAAYWFFDEISKIALDQKAEEEVEKKDTTLRDVGIGGGLLGAHVLLAAGLHQALKGAPTGAIKDLEKRLLIAGKRTKPPAILYSSEPLISPHEAYSLMPSRGAGGLTGLEQFGKVAGIGPGRSYLHRVGKPNVRPTNPLPPEEKYRVKKAMIPTSPTAPGTPMQKLTKSQTVGTPDDKNMLKFKPMSIQQPKSVKEPSGAPMAQAPSMPSMPKVGEAPQGSLTEHRVRTIDSAELPQNDIPGIMEDASEYQISKKKQAFAVSSFSGSLGEPHRVIPPPQAPWKVPNIYGQDPQLKESGEKEPSFILDRNRERNEKMAAVALTPKGQLSLSQKEGKPKSTGFSGPSISSVSKPVGYGRTLPGTAKNRI